MKMYPDKDQAEVLNRGIANLSSEFAAVVCPVCKGAGEYRQTYTAGCGMGSYQSTGSCDWCEGEGVLMNGKAASSSVINQIRVASSTL